MKYLNIARRNVTVAAAMVGGLLLMQTLIAPVAYAGPPARKFYLTQTSFDGAHALTACATGFHMASLWEIFNVSVVEYDTSLGFTSADSGFGPPNIQNGWIRTGYISQAASTPGLGNCNAWTSSSSLGNGSAVHPEVNWSNTLANPIPPWRGSTFACNLSIPVWCVQDFSD
jgi:hypothetical protein